jgi:hypothetical protein
VRGVAAIGERLSAGRHDVPGMGGPADSSPMVRVSPSLPFYLVGTPHFPATAKLLITPAPSCTRQ